MAKTNAERRTPKTPKRQKHPNAKKQALTQTKEISSSSKHLTPYEPDAGASSNSDPESAVGGSSSCATEDHCGTGRPAYSRVSACQKHRRDGVKLTSSAADSANERTASTKSRSRGPKGCCGGSVGRAERCARPAKVMRPSSTRADSRTAAAETPSPAR
jgi:hypothetical protein